MTDNVLNGSRLRNARACEACRAGKSRCIFKSHQGVCQRCEESGNQCVVRAKARPMRTPTNRSSISPAKNPPHSSIDSDVLLDLPAVHSPGADEDSVALHRHHEHIFEADDPSRDSQSQSSPVPFPLPIKPVRQTLIEQRKVTLSQAEELLSSFRGKAPFFPFVHIPIESTVQSLSRTSTFLLLAVLTSASVAEPLLHHQIDHEFRRVLSSKVIVDGRKSLDFLQGLLVYLTWYPFHSSQKNNQSFIYMNLAISLSVDLGLDNEIPLSTNFNSIDTQGLIEDGLFTTAAKRAYLGCYYLSSALSLGFQKPNNLRYRNLMDVHAEFLLLEEHAVDVYSMVKLQRLAEQSGEIYSSNHPIHTESLTAEMNVQIFMNRLHEWRVSTSNAVRNLAFVGVAERFVNVIIYSHELGFLRRSYKAQLQTKSMPTVNQFHLSSCLVACKSFFEYFLALPESNFLEFTNVQWSHIVQAILVLSRLTFLMAANLGWDSNTTRSNVPMVMYLDCLCYRFQHLSTTKSDSPESLKSPDVLYVLKKILDSLKKSYEHRVANINPKLSSVDHDNVTNAASRHCPMSDPSLGVFFNDGYSPDSGFFDESRNVTSDMSALPAPVYHDIWITMTGSWAKPY